VFFLHYGLSLSSLAARWWKNASIVDELEFAWLSERYRLALESRPKMIDILGAINPMGTELLSPGIRHFLRRKQLSLSQLSSILRKILS